MFYHKLSLLFFFLISLFQSQAQQTPISTEDVWKGMFYARSTGGLRSMSDGLHFTVLNREGPSIDKYSYESGKKVAVLLSAEMIETHADKKLNFDSYQFSPDEDKLLLGAKSESIYRHSSRSYNYIYDLESNTLDSVVVNGKQQLADFSPTENKVAFVYENRMHIQDLDNQNEIISFGQGKEDALIAGAVDWVYEEEFSFHKGFQWSPQGSFIAYYQFDETEVPTFSMDVFGKGLYPSQQVFKYPKAGEVNSKVSIHVWDVKTQKDHEIELAVPVEYYPRIRWTNADNELIISTLNRHQDHIILWKISIIDGKPEVSKLYEEQATSYLDIHDNLRFLKDGSFIWTSEKDGFNHLYHFDKNGKQKRQITKGNWEVTDFYGIDESKGLLYFQSAEASALGRDVYSIKLNGRSKTKLSSQIGWNGANFSGGFQFFINRFSSANKPTYETLHRSSGKLVRVINDNAGLNSRLEKYAVSDKEFMQIPNEEGTLLNAWMIKPMDFDATKSYPVLMFVYGGPGSQTVKDQWDSYNAFWFRALAAKGYIVVSVDNRGTGARGRDFRTQTYQQLGKYETEDQISAAKWLGKQDYIDANRIGIWGWSYGGYMSSLALTKGAEVFKMAIAVAPVTNWRFYDNIYTERYMRTPQENAAGYDENSPINHVDKMTGSYLLVHGSADDNVHVQNTMRMIESLVQANKQFDLFIYPDKNHGIYGGNTRLHLYTKMTRFIEENL
jgi:dipeptidyl-peptidase-4